ncbi:sulfatase [Termitidicoccus mucosus]
MKSRLRKTASLGLGFATGLAPVSIQAQAQAKNPAGARPNIVFIVADDMGWTDGGCFGSDFIETPNIDRLRGQGLYFTNAYVTAPVCMPSRAGFMTGRYQARFGMTDPTGPKQADRMTPLIEPLKHINLPKSEPTLGKMMKSAGYVTACIGKWHLGDQNKPGYTQKDAGFDFIVKDPNNKSPYGKSDYKCINYFNDNAIKFIEANKGSPFFLYLAHYAPHLPIQTPDELIAKYKEKRKPGRIHSNAPYAAMIEYFDRGIGRLLAKLDELGIADDTLVVFTSDNGGRNSLSDYEIVTYNTPLKWGKHTLAEGGIRIPLIMRWPGHILAGGTCSEPVISVDYMSTFAAVSGAPAGATGETDGVSLTPLFAGKGSLAPRNLFFFYPHYNFGSDFGEKSILSWRPATAVRNGDYKLMDFFEDPKMVELYNLREDVSERTNLANDMPGKVEEMRAAINAWHKHVNADLPISRPKKQYKKAQLGMPLGTFREVESNE